jgi:micrococcal nuclease
MQYFLEKIKDGDTLIVCADTHRKTLRLYGIDCPELGQKPYGKQARKRIEQLLPLNSEIKAIAINYDSYNRLIAEVWIADICINTQLLLEGYAVAYYRHLIGEYRQRYIEAEAIARTSKLKFWSQPKIEMPWHYRKRTNIYYQAVSQQP